VLRRVLPPILLSLGAALSGCASTPAPKLSFAELYAAPPPAAARIAAPAAARATLVSPAPRLPAGPVAVAARAPSPVPPSTRASSLLAQLPELALRTVGPSLRPAPAGAATASGAALVLDWPVEPVAVTSGFGRRNHPVTGRVRRHLGLDLAASEGQVVSTAGRGRVVRAGWRRGYGLQVEVVHPGGVHTRYGHLSRVLVEKGALLEPGDLVGLAGNTGLSTGPHLHFELWREGRAQDPLPALAPRPAGLQTREGRRPSGRRPR
jgi:murein DD-endopeptidase MepM/ murein hydrolase activator NlpD